MFMSYCVNCGVELDRSLKKCPLCSTIVVNPNDIDEDTAVTTYPVETISKVVRQIKKLVGAFITVIFSVISVLCPLCNYIISDRITWSRYVILSVIFLWFCVVPPIIMEKKILIKSVLIDFLSACVYLSLMNYFTTPDINWFMNISFPILLYLLGEFVLLYSLAGKKIKVLYIVSAGIVLAGIFCVMTEYFISKFRFGSIGFVWSVPVLVSCIGVALLLVIISKLSKLSAIKKLMHI